MCKDGSAVPASTPDRALLRQRPQRPVLEGQAPLTFTLVPSGGEKMLGSPGTLPERRTTDLSALIAVQATLLMGQHCA